MSYDATKTPQYPGLALHSFCEFLIDHPAAEITIRYREQLQAICIQAEIIEAHDNEMRRYAFETFISARYVKECAAPGHPLAEGFGELLRTFNKHFSKHPKDEKP